MAWKGNVSPRAPLREFLTEGPNKMATTYHDSQDAVKNNEVLIVAYGSDMHYPDGRSNNDDYAKGDTGIVQDCLQWKFQKNNVTFLMLDVRKLGLTNPDHDASNPGANHSVLKYLSVKQKGMWEALVLLIGLLVLVTSENSGSKGKHRAAGAGSLLSLATGYPCFFVTFNEPDVWVPRWYHVRLPDPLPQDDEVNDFIISVADTAKYPFRSETRRELAWKLVQVKHNLVDPDSELAQFVYDNGLQNTPQDDQGYYEDTDEENAIDNFKKERATKVRRTRRLRREATPDGEDDADDEEDETDESEDRPPVRTSNTQFPVNDAVDDDGFARVARTRKGKRLGVDDDIPPKMCLENYSTVDRLEFLEFALAKARERGGQQAVDKLCSQMSREREKKFESACVREGLRFIIVVIVLSAVGSAYKCNWYLLYHDYDEFWIESGYDMDLWRCSSSIALVSKEEREESEDAGQGFQTELISKFVLSKIAGRSSNSWEANHYQLEQKSIPRRWHRPILMK
eukprot:s1967_g4.t1